MHHCIFLENKCCDVLTRKCEPVKGEEHAGGQDAPAHGGQEPTDFAPGNKFSWLWPKTFLRWLCLGCKNNLKCFFNLGFPFASKGIRTISWLWSLFATLHFGCMMTLPRLLRVLWTLNSCFSLLLFLSLRRTARQNKLNVGIIGFFSPLSMRIFFEIKSFRFFRNLILNMTALNFLKFLSRIWPA